jgi:hypothetical protein
MFEVSRVEGDHDEERKPPYYGSKRLRRLPGAGTTDPPKKPNNG